MMGQDVNRSDAAEAPTVPRRPGPGRPAVLAAAERRRRCIDAAEKIFIQNGYAAATMAMIAAQAAMSKKTLYQLFESKLTLFEALLRDRLFLPLLPTVPVEGSQEAQLTHLMLSIAEALLEPERTALIRLLVAEGPAYPELMAAFERLQMDANMNAMSAWLAQESQAGRLQVDDIVDTSRLLFGVTIAEPILQALLRTPSISQRSDRTAAIERGVRFFLRCLQRDG